MKLDVNTINEDLVILKAVTISRKEGIVMITDTGKTNKACLIMSGDNAGRYCLIPIHSGVSLNDRFEHVLIVHKSEVLVLFNLDEDEEATTYLKPTATNTKKQGGIKYESTKSEIFG